MKIVDCEQGTEDWKDFRENGIGSSEIAAIMGLSPYKKPIDIYNEKMGITQPFVNEAMQRGTENEKFARQRLENTTGFSFPAICCIHDDFDYIRASLDGWNDKAKIVLEIKTPLKKNYLQMCAEIPVHYRMQIQWQMMVCNAIQGMFVVDEPDSGAQCCIDVSPDLDLWDKMKSAAEIFWDNFLKGIAPDDGSDDFIDIDDKELESLSDNWIMFDEMEKAAKKMKDTLRQKMLDFGDDGSFRGTALKFKKIYREGSVDFKGMCLSLLIPLEVLEKYRKPGSWYYTITRNKEE